MNDQGTLKSRASKGAGLSFKDCGKAGAEGEAMDSQILSLMPIYKLSSINPLLRFDEAPRGARSFILSWELNKVTGILQFNVPNHRAYGCALFYDGKVIGCSYYRESYAKLLEGKEAWWQIWKDATNNTHACRVGGYALEKQVVLSAAALYHQEIYKPSETYSTEDLFEVACLVLANASRPGLVLISDVDDVPILAVFICSGKIVGLFSYRDSEDWLAPNYENAFEYLKCTNEPQVFASMLAAENFDELESLAFSISSVIDKSGLKANNLIGCSHFGWSGSLFSSEDTV
jgi:hypothetical protein